MTRRSVGVRGLRLLAALLQLGLPGAAAWADARLDAAGAGAQPHIESHTTDACARVHAPDCALCHFLTTPLAARCSATPRLDVAAPSVTGVAPPAPLPRAADRPHPQPRAPPALS